MPTWTRKLGNWALVGLLVLITLQSALAHTTDHNISLSKGPSSKTECYGFNFTISTDAGHVSIRNITYASGVSATHCWLYNATPPNSHLLVDNGLFSGSACPVDYDVWGGETLIMCVDANGSSWNNKYQDSGLSYPYTTSLGNWTDSAESGDGRNTFTGNTAVGRSLLSFDWVNVSGGGGGSDTHNSYTINVTNLYDDGKLSGVNATFGASCWNTTDANGIATVTNQSDGCTVLNGAVNASAVNLSITNYVFNQTSYYIAANGTAWADAWEGRTNISGKNIHNTPIDEDGYVNVSGGKNYSANITESTWIYLTSGVNEVNWTPDTHWPDVKNITSAGNGSSIETTWDDLTNTYLLFQGSVTGDEISPECTENGSGITHTGRYYWFSTGNHTIECPAGANYPAKNFTLWKNASLYNRTLDFDEYSLILNFSAAINGSIYWQNAYGNLTNTTYYNVTNVQYIRLKSTLPDETYVTVTFNAGANGTKQYYQYLNRNGVQTSDRMRVLDSLDYFLRIQVLNFANEIIPDATIRIVEADDDTGSNIWVLQQIISNSITGLSYQGRPFYMDSGKYIHISVTKSGYQTERINMHTDDYDSGETIEIRLRPVGNQNSDRYTVVGPTTHNNDTSMTFLVTHPAQSIIYYNTTFSPGAPIAVSLSNGGATFDVNCLGQTGNCIGANYTLNVYTLDSNNNYNLEVSWRVLYDDETPYQLLSAWNTYLNNNNETLIAVILWVVLVFLAGGIGNMVKRESTFDTGYYVFGFGVFIMGLLLPILIPVAGIMALTLIGSLYASGTRT